MRSLAYLVVLLLCFVAAVVGLSSCRLLLSTPGIPLEGLAAPTGTFGGSATPGPYWSYGPSVEGFFLQPASSSGIWTQPGTFPGIFTLPVQLPKPPGKSGPPTFTAYVRLFVNGCWRDGLPPDVGPRPLLMSVYSSEPLAFPSSGPHWQGRYTRGEGTLSQDGKTLTLAPWTWWLGAAQADNTWTRLDVTKGSDQTPPVQIPEFLIGGPGAFDRLRYPRSVAPGFFGDWYGKIDDEFCAGENCVSLDGELTVHLESVTALDVSEAYRGAVLGWADFDGSVNGEKGHSLHAIFSGEATAPAGARGMLSLRLTDGGAGGNVELDLFTVLTNLWLLQDEQQLRVTYLAKEVLLARDTRNNAAPAVQIVSPPEGTVVSIEDPLELELLFLDPNQTELPPPEHIDWLDGDGQRLDVARIAPNRARLRSWTTGERVVRVRVRDAGGLTATDSIKVRFAGEPPNAPSIFAPRPFLDGLGDTEFLVSAPGEVVLHGCGYDPEEGELGDAALEWSSSLDGVLGKGRVMRTTLSAGDHFLTLRATDSEGLSAESSLLVRIQPYAGNAPPQVYLVAPEGVYCHRSISARPGDTLTFVAAAFDPDGAPATPEQPGLSLVWNMREVKSAPPLPPIVKIGAGTTAKVTLPAGITATYWVFVTATDDKGLKHVTGVRVSAAPLFTVD